MSGDTRALRQTTGSPPETGGCEPGRYKLLPEPVAEAPAILRAGRCLSDPTGHRPRFDDEAKSVCRSVAGKRPPKTAATEIVRRHDTVVPDIGIPYFSGNYILRYAEVSACRLRIRPQTSAATDYASGRPAPDRHQEDHPENAAAEPPTAHPNAVMLYQAGISPAQSSARPQPFEARRPVDRPTNPPFRKDRKSYRGGREHRPPPSDPGPKTKKRRAPETKGALPETIK